MAFAVLLAVSGGEDLAGTAAGLELTDPLAVRVGGTSRGVGDGAASTRAFLAFVVPQAVGVGFALSGSGVGDGAGGLAGVVDLHALAVGGAASSITRELGAGSTAGAGGGVPLAAWVGLAVSLTSLVGFLADGSASAGSGVPVAGGELRAASLVSRSAVANTVAQVVDLASLGGVAGSEGRAGISASLTGGLSTVELAFRVAGA